MRALTVYFCGSIMTAMVFVQQGQPSRSIELAQAPRIDVYDGFETPRLSDLWETNHFSPGAVEMQSDVVRAGRGAVRIVIRPRDKFEAGQGGNPDSERDELLEARRLFARENVAYEYSFSMFFPKDFLIVPTRLVIAQWKQDCADNGPCSDDSPVLAFRYVSGELLVTQSISKHKVILYRHKDEFRNRWLDFRVRARFTSGTDGRVKVWLDGKRLVDFTGVTANPEDATTGYPGPSSFYFKMGLYRDRMAEPMTIYIDEYRKRALANEEP